MGVPRILEWRPTRSNWPYAFAALAVLLVAPLGVSRSAKKPLWPGLPGVLSGDEPHYLVMIHSLIDDGDFDLANNYRDVHRGGLQAGRIFAGEPLDHHVNWYEDGRLVKWWQVYEMEPERWERDGDGRPVPTPRRGEAVRSVGGREYSQHPVGLAVLLAPFLFAFRNTALVEPAALLCSGLATVGGCWAWCRLAAPYARSPARLFAAAAVAYLGSPLWHYGQNLFSESFLAFFCVAAFAAALRADSMFLAGLFVGAGVLVKTPFGLVAVPLIGDALLRRDARRALACAVPVVLAGGLVMEWNRRMYGGWLRNPQEWEAGSPLAGVLGLAFSWEHGLLLSTPALALAALAFPGWLRQYPREAVIITSAALLYGGLMASWAQWWGGTCYSARLILPVVPLLFAPLAYVFDSWLWKSGRILRGAVAAVMAVSVVFGAVAAFGCDYVWVRQPFELFL